MDMALQAMPCSDMNRMNLSNLDINFPSHFFFETRDSSSNIHLISIYIYILSLFYVLINKWRFPKIGLPLNHPFEWDFPLWTIHFGGIIFIFPCRWYIEAARWWWSWRAVVPACHDLAWTALRCHGIPFFWRKNCASDSFMQYLF